MFGVIDSIVTLASRHLLGMDENIVHSYSQTFRDYLSVGLLVKTNDIMPVPMLNLLTSAWGGDMEQTRQYKEDYVIRRQTVYLKELRDYSVRTGNKRLIAAFNKIIL